jgi:hypothetical protein
VWLPVDGGSCVATVRALDGSMTAQQRRPGSSGGQA